MQGKEEFNNILKGYNMMLYFAGTMIMFDPSHECIYDFWSEGILRKLPVSSSNPEFIKAASLLRQSSDDKNVYPRMKEDFKRLFDPSGPALAVPRKSLYLAEMSGPGINERVEEFYDSYGWKSKFKGMIPEDHIGVELLFLTLMIDKLLELDDDVCNKEMKREIKRFIATHISSWVPSWNRKVQESAFSLSYKGISSLIQSCTEDISEIMARG